jgi:3-(3-hydroxy-phenyl)propionate hydroxylase
VLFAGDSAHGVSPFGARGANSGVQDADNLAWKLRLVVQGEAPDALLDSYASEREYAADENILNSTRATDFITPKSEVSRLFRDAVLQLTKRHAFARTLVNSGRLSVATVLRDSPLNTADADALPARWCPAPRRPMRPWCAPMAAPAGCCASAMSSASPRWCSARARPPSAACRRCKRRPAAAHRARASRHRGRTRRAALRRATRYRLPAAARPARVRALAATHGSHIRAALDRALAKA